MPDGSLPSRGVPGRDRRRPSAAPARCLPLGRLAVPGRGRDRAGGGGPPGARARPLRPRDAARQRRRHRRARRDAGEEPRPPRRPRAAGRAGRPGDDAGRPARLARPGGPGPGRRAVADRHARRVLGPPHHGRGLPRADRPRGQGAAFRPARRPAPRDQARGLPAARRRVLVRGQGRDRRARRDPARMRRARRRRRRPDRGPPGAAAAGADDAFRSGWRWPGRRRSKAGGSRMRRARSATPTRRAPDDAALPPSAATRRTVRSRRSPARTAGRVGRSGWRCCWSFSGAPTSRCRRRSSTPCRRAASCSSAT